MCGIVGLINRRGGDCEKVDVYAMNSAVVHRGPDDDGYVFDGPVGLGFRRLSIIDLEGGHQPLANEDESVWIVFNGEIYNYRELRSDLAARGHVFRTESDTEVIVHLYEEYGVDSVKRLRGMFAFAIWDRRERLLFLARDPFGIKPLYYYHGPDQIGFASEIKSLLQLRGVSREVNREAFWNYLTFQYVPEPMTMFAGIRKLRPAHYAVIRDGEITERRYYQLQFNPGRESMEHYIQGTIERLRESVRVHMNSDVPRGAFLSSGVDSSAIVALLKELEEVQTFTVGFEGAGGQSEIAYARETAKLLATIHRDTVISADTYLKELPRLVFHQDEPVADPSAIALHFVAELASQYVTVVLSGEGADEIFGGYTIYREPLSLRMFDFIPMSMRQGMGEAARFLPEGMKGRSFLMRGAKPVEDRFFGNANLFAEADKAAFVRIDPTREGLKRPLDITRPFYRQVADADDVTKMQFIDLHTWLPGDILMKADKMTMANSLELRVPFLDKEVFEFAAQIPADYRLASGTTKHVLRESVRGILPKEVTERRKLGFPVPTRQWLRKEHYQFARDLIGSNCLPDLFDREHVLRMLDDHRSGLRDNARKVWTIVIFLLWYEAYVEQSRVFVSKESEHAAARRMRTLAEANV